MLPSEQILEQAAQDGTMDMYAPLKSIQMPLIDKFQRRMASRARDSPQAAA
jgi:hypothetical protein